VAKVSEVRTWIRRDKSTLSPSAKPDPPVPTIVRDNLPPELRHPIEEHNPFRAILLPPRSIPAPRLRLPAKSTRDERRRLLRAHLALSAKVRFAEPDSNAIPNLPLDTLNLDLNGSHLHTPQPSEAQTDRRGPKQKLRKSSDSFYLAPSCLSHNLSCPKNAGTKMKSYVTTQS
jgi:hypothetical protein